MYLIRLNGRTALLEDRNGFNNLRLKNVSLNAVDDRLTALQKQIILANRARLLCMMNKVSFTARLVELGHIYMRHRERNVVKRLRNSKKRNVFLLRGKRLWYPFCCEKRITMDVSNTYR